MSFRDLRLSTKQAIGFGIILVIMASVNVFSIQTMNSLKHDIDDVTSNRLPSALAIAGIKSSISDMRTAQLQRAVSKDEAEQLELVGTMGVLIEEIEKNQARFESLPSTDSEGALYAQFEQLWESYADIFYRFIGLLREDKQNDAVTLLATEGSSVYQEMSAIVNQLVEINEQASNQAASDAASRFTTTRRVVRSLVIITVLVSILIAGWLARWITVPVRHLALAAERIESGDLSVEVVGESKDEIGKLATSFNRMTGALRDARTALETKNHDLEDALQQLRDTQQQLVMAEKMASLGNLVAGVAHEINNPVGAVKSAADTSSRSIDIVSGQIENTDSLQTLKENRRFNTALQIIRDNNALTIEASSRITDIVQSLKNFARLDESDFQEADIHEGLDSTLTLLNHKLRGHVEVVRDYGDVPRIQCYPNQLNQVFMNILSNAGQAIEGEGTVTVSTRRADSPNDNNIVVSFSDTGKGIDAENVSHIFDPGFTTKGVGVGTGLGLSISYNIIQKHHGKIDVESELGKGTTMSVTLPIHQLDGKT
jgi:signal transduction histidine kinase